MTRDNDRAVPRRARGKRSAEKSSGNKPSKRRKTQTDGEEKSPAVLPSIVLSHSEFSSGSATLEIVSSNRRAGISHDRNDRDAVSATNDVLPTLPYANTRQQAYKQTDHQSRDRTRAPNISDGKRHEGSSQNEKDSHKNACAGRMTAFSKPPAPLDNSRKSIHLHRSQQQPFPTLCRRLISVGVIVYFAFDLYRSSLFYEHSAIGKSTPLSNATVTPILHATLDDTMRRMPYKTTRATCSQHLLELDAYERQTTVLAKTETELARALADLANSRHDTVLARVEVASTKDAYTSVVSDLDQAKKELADTKHKLELTLLNLSDTREELERTRWDLTMSIADSESLSEQLNEAYQDIEHLYELLELQETVATNALNFVATTAVKQQQEVAAHALNFVTTLAVKQKRNNCVSSDVNDVSNVDV